MKVGGGEPLFRRPLPVAEFAQKRSPVALDCSSGIIFGEAEIEITLTVSAGESSEPRGESVHQPGQFAQVLARRMLSLVCFGFDWKPGLPLIQFNLEAMSGGDVQRVPQ